MLTRSESGRLGAIAAKATQNALFKQRRDDYLLDPKHCLSCTNILQFEKRLRYRFCSSSCAATYNNNEKPTRRRCLCCDNLTGKGSKYYCSPKCMREFHWREKVDAILSSGLIPSAPTGRKYFLSKHGNICQICSRCDWDGVPIPLVLDHINGNPDDWRIENLRLICPNCDALTPTYKGKNKGNGRASRRQRYRDGKSY